MWLGWPDVAFLGHDDSSESLEFTHATPLNGHNWPNATDKTRLDAKPLIQLSCSPGGCLRHYTAFLLRSRDVATAASDFIRCINIEKMSSGNHIIGNAAFSSAHVYVGTVQGRLKFWSGFIYVTRPFLFSLTFPFLLAFLSRYNILAYNVHLSHIMKDITSVQFMDLPTSVH